MSEFRDFLLWEAASRDTIDFKKIYVDMAGDLNAGLVLSELVYWYLPSRNGASKLRIQHDDHEWIAVRRYEWWERTRMSPKEADRALRLLKDAGLIEKLVRKFDGDPTVHIRLIEATFLARWNTVLTSPPENPFLPKGNNQLPKTATTISPKRESPVTETTAKTTTETKGSSLPQLLERPNIFKLLEDLTGTIPPLLVDDLKDAEKEFSADWIADAFKEAAASNGRSWKYVRAILDRWRRDGKGAPRLPAERPQNAMFNAVSWAWNNRSGGYVGKLIKFLTGTCAPTDGSYYDWQIADPMTPVEVVAFRLWRDYEELDMPKKPETIQRTVEEFRGVPEYERILIRAAEQLAQLMSPPEPPTAVQDTVSAPDADAPEGVPSPSEVAAAFDALAARFGGGQ